MEDQHAGGPDGNGRASVRVAVDPGSADTDVLAEAGAMIRAGGLVAFPTETVYGLGADALNSDATASIFEAKGRPSSDPLIVHVSSIEEARSLADRWDPAADRLAHEFWPGPLTLVVPKRSIVPDGITAGKATVAIRVPVHPVARGLIAAAERPVAAPSANRFGRISPTSADAVEAELGGRYDMLLDAGPTSVGVESTVVDLTGHVPVVLRPGGVTVERLRALVADVEVRSEHSQAEDLDATAPGQFLRHYSPSTPLVAVRGSVALAREVARGLETSGVSVHVVDLPSDASAAANQLYARLRSADGSADVIVIGMVDPAGLGRAVNDRLYRAARGIVIDSADEVALRVLADTIRDRTV